METVAPASPRATAAQALTEDLIHRAGLTPGMRVLVAAADCGETALLVAERVGAGGKVVAVDSDPVRHRIAAQRVREQRFAHVTPVAGGIMAGASGAPYDAVVGQHYLLFERDPVGALRCAAELVRDGGRMLFVEWHLESVLWPHASSWPGGPLYGEVAQCAVEGMRAGGLQVDIGLRLINAFVEAGLPLPAVRTELRVLTAANTGGFEVFTEMLRDAELEIANVAARLRAEVAVCGGHAFLPLLVGAWTCVAR